MTTKQSPKEGAATAFDSSGPKGIMEYKCLQTEQPQPDQKQELFSVHSLDS